MSGALLPNITYAAQNVPLYGAGGGAVSTLGSPLTVGTGNFSVVTGINTGPDSATIGYVSAGVGLVSQVFSQASPGVGRVGWFNANGPSMTLSDRLYTAEISTANLQVSSINGASPGAGAIQSTIANSGTYIDIPGGALPVNFNLLNGGSFSTPGNAGIITMNGIIANNATSAAAFNNGLTASTINGSVPYTNFTADIAVSTIQAGTSSNSPNGITSAISLNANTSYRLSFSVTGTNASATGNTSIYLAGNAGAKPVLGCFPNSLFNAPSEGPGGIASCVVTNTNPTAASCPIFAYNTGPSDTILTLSKVFVENLGPLDL